MKAPDRILELCKNEVSAILGATNPVSVQEEQLLSPVLKYLVAYANKPNLCTETQISRRLSISRPTVTRIMQTLEGYHVVQPVADFGTVKPYEVTNIGTAFRASWIRLQPEEVPLLFGVRTSKRFDTQGRFEGYIRGKDGARWPPPMKAAASFFQAIAGKLDIKPSIEYEYSGYEIDAYFLGQLIDQSMPFWPLTLSDLLVMEDKQIDQITAEDFAQARRRLAEKYCWIFYYIAEKMISQESLKRDESLSYMAEILESCIQVATIFGAEGQISIGRELLKRINNELRKT